MVLKVKINPVSLKRDAFHCVNGTSRNFQSNFLIDVEQALCHLLTLKTVEYRYYLGPT